jgi:multidrug resistance efflux pump
VDKGVVIARLSDRDPQAELRKITAEINEKRAKLKMLKAGTRREEIELTRMEAGAAKTRVEEALNLLPGSQTHAVRAAIQGESCRRESQGAGQVPDHRLTMFKTLLQKT